MSEYMVGPGWWAFLDEKLPELYQLLPDTDIDVKEKFGQCRVEFFLLTADKEKLDKVMQLAHEIEEMSGHICELCGNPGSIRNDRGWFQCRCDRCHAADRDERRAIMTQTSDEYHNTIDRILNSVAGNMALSDMELTERDKARIRYAIRFPDKIDDILKQIIESHRAT